MREWIGKERKEESDYEERNLALVGGRAGEEGASNRSNVYSGGLRRLFRKRGFKQLIEKFGKKLPRF